MFLNCVVILLCYRNMPSKFFALGNWVKFFLWLVMTNLWKFCRTILLLSILHISKKCTLFIHFAYNNSWLIHIHCAFYLFIINMTLFSIIFCLGLHFFDITPTTFFLLVCLVILFKGKILQKVHCFLGGG